MAWTHRYVTVAGAGDNTGDSSDFSDAMTLAQAIADAATPHVGYCYNIKAGTYTPGDVLAFATAGATTTPNWWRGCHTVAGDLDDGTHARDAAGSEGTNMPLFDMSDDAAHQVTIAGAHQWFSNIAIKSICTTAAGAVNASGGSLRFVRCRFTNSANNSNARSMTYGGASPVTVHCRFQAHTGSINGASTQGLFIGCHFVGGAAGIGLGSTAAIFTSCVIEGYATTGIVYPNATGQHYVLGSTIYGGTNGVLVSTIPTTGLVFIANSIIGGCTNGVNNNTGGNTNSVVLVRNHFYSCTNNIVGLQEVATFDDTLGVLCGLIDNDTDPFVAKASSDYTLAAANTIDRATGWPGVMEGQTAMNGTPDIGAIHHAGPAAANVRATDYTASGAAGSIATITPSNATVSQDAGYYAAFNLSTVDADLAAGNIKKDTVVFGVTGTYEGGGGGGIWMPRARTVGV